MANITSYLIFIHIQHVKQVNSWRKHSSYQGSAIDVDIDVILEIKYFSFYVLEMHHFTAYQEVLMNGEWLLYLAWDNYCGFFH